TSFIFPCKLRTDTGKQQPKAATNPLRKEPARSERPAPLWKKHHDPNTSATGHDQHPATPLSQRLRPANLIAGTAGLIVVMIFIIQNAHAVNISFLGAHLRLSLAVALLLAAIAGALLM